jgi:DNA-binding phage protein
MIPVTTCPGCKLVQFFLLSPGSDTKICRRCGAHLGFSVIEIRLDQSKPHPQNGDEVSLGSVLRSLRRKRFMTQLHVAKPARTDRSHIARLEGNVTSPNLTSLIKILRAVGVTAVYLRTAEADHVSRKPDSQK